MRRDPTEGAPDGQLFALHFPEDHSGPTEKDMVAETSPSLPARARLVSPRAVPRSPAPAIAHCGAQSPAGFFSMVAIRCFDCTPSGSFGYRVAHAW